uniref:Regulatory protein zeste n=1 Tax=Plectus sambesii TaxID=2011161 RepID=A0A914VUR7_9BILA
MRATALVLRSQQVEWEAIASMINPANLAIVRTWDEVRKKFNNLAMQAKSLHAQYKGDLMATGGGCLPEELPSWAAFIVKRILPLVVLEGLDGGFESGVAAPIPEAIVEAVDYLHIDDREMDMDIWGIVPAEVALSTPIDTSINTSAPSQRSSARKLSPKESLDALATEKAKFEGEAEKLCAKN